MKTDGKFKLSRNYFFLLPLAVVNDDLKHILMLRKKNEKFEIVENTAENIVEQECKCCEMNFFVVIISASVRSRLL